MTAIALEVPSEGGYNALVKLMALVGVLVLSVNALADGKDDVPHDGRLAVIGETIDLSTGTLSEPREIVATIDSCTSNLVGETFRSQAQAVGYCGCVADWLRTSSPRSVRSFLASGKSGDLSSADLASVRVCVTWAQKGMHEPLPHLKSKMMTSGESSGAIKVA